MKLLTYLWYKKTIMSYVLWPLSLLYQFIIKLRRFAYQKKILHRTQFPLPIIIVGNITVGGTGKTPLVIYLASYLKQQGYKPGIVSRGYGGKAKRYPLKVTQNSQPSAVGDEPVIIAKQTQCPVYVAPDRVAAVKQLLRENNCNIIISDDGLQHYALMRTLEIAVIDGERRLGNELCLPAGPLREPAKRLREVDVIVCNGQARAGEYAMILQPQNFCQLNDATHKQTAEFFKTKIIHAVAGIGNPARFFAVLRQLELSIIEHPFPDHYLFQASDFKFAKNEIIIMTEKDAIKCQVFANENFWYLPVQAYLSNEFNKELLKKITINNNSI